MAPKTPAQAIRHGKTILWSSPTKGNVRKIAAGSMVVAAGLALGTLAGEKFEVLVWFAGPALTMAAILFVGTQFDKEAFIWTEGGSFFAHDWATGGNPILSWPARELVWARRVSIPKSYNGSLIETPFLEIQLVDGSTHRFSHPLSDSEVQMAVDAINVGLSLTEPVVVPPANADAPLAVPKKAAREATKKADERAARHSRGARRGL